MNGDFNVEDAEFAEDGVESDKQRPLAGEDWFGDTTVNRIIGDYSRTSYHLSIDFHFYWMFIRTAGADSNGDWRSCGI
jgi:hypothetical protein